MNIKAVTFDAGGTLIHPWPSVGHVYAEVAARHGHSNIPPETLNNRFSAAWRGLNHFNHRREEWAALVDRVFDGLVPAPPSETFFPELFDHFGEPEAWRIFDDVSPALDALASHGIALAVISNWDDRLGPLLEKMNLRKHFDAVIISYEIGFSKPSPVIFEHAARKLGLAPEFILHVGDSPDHDIAGATAAGFQSVLVDRKKPASKRGQIASLTELESLLPPRG